MLQDSLIKRALGERSKYNELKGNFNFKFNGDGIDKYYNQNELGIFNLKNAQVFRSSVRYKMAKENKFLRSYNSLFFLNNRFRFHDFLRTGSGGFRFMIILNSKTNKFSNSF